jgi:hypothetical protein
MTGGSPGNLNRIISLCYVALRFLGYGDRALFVVAAEFAGLEKPRRVRWVEH